MRSIPSFPTRRASDLDRLCDSKAPEERCQSDALDVEFAADGPRTGAAANQQRRSIAYLGVDLYAREQANHFGGDRKSTRLNSSHLGISYAVFCLKKKT